MEIMINNEKFTLSLIWLRNQCLCEKCYNHTTNQRKNPIQLTNIEIKQQKIDQRSIYITWEDGHKSKYDVEWLEKYTKKVEKYDIETWEGNEINEKIAKIKRNEIENEQNQIKLLKSILKYGVAMVTEVKDTIEDTEKVLTSIGPITNYIYGSMWKVESNSVQYKEYLDTAYGNESLALHTDTTYFQEPVGLMAFHILLKSIIGGETLLVDGFKAVEILKDKNIKDYENLSNIPVTWRFVNKRYNCESLAPVININPYTKHLRQIRHNPYDIDVNLSRSVSNTGQIDLFYKSWNNFTNIVNNNKMWWKIKLLPGTILIFNNWRILHGREGFTGARVYCGGCIDMTYFLSKLRLLKLI